MRLEALLGHLAPEDTTIGQAVRDAVSALAKEIRGIGVISLSATAADPVSGPFVRLKPSISKRDSIATGTSQGATPTVQPVRGEAWRDAGEGHRRPAAGAGRSDWRHSEAGCAAHGSCRPAAASCQQPEARPPGCPPAGACGQTVTS